jgi:DNA replication licensing factor MCM2
VVQEVTGVYRNNFDVQLNSTNGFPLFSTVIEANYVSKREDLFAAYRLTQDDKAAILELARDPRIGRRVCFVDL